MSNSQFLRRALIADSLISSTFGLLFILASAPVAEFMGIPNPLVAVLLGVGQVIFGVLVGRESRQALTPTSGYVIGTLNALFVVGSVLILATEAFGLTTAGRWAILVAADMVLTLAVLQFIGARRISALVRVPA